jgi:hypothetical protein
MVKKRLLFLVLLQVASILVSSEHHDDNGEYPPGTIFGAVEDTPNDAPQEPIENEDAPFIPIPVDPVPAEGPIAMPAEEPVVMPAEEPVVMPAEEPVVMPAEEPVVDGIENFEDDQDETANEEEDFEVETFTSKVMKKTRRKRTTTSAPIIPCEEMPEVIETKKNVISTPMEGFTADQCEFLIVDQTNCKWEYRCGATITEPPTEPPPPPEEEDDSAEDEIEECEPKKKFKFDNCFLKIRGLIKKKKPKRC